MPRPPRRGEFTFRIMAKNSATQIIRTVLLAGLIGLLFWKLLLVPTPAPADAADWSYTLDQVAESGNLTPYSELDAKLLASRKILLTSSINANSTKQVVASLFVLDEADPNAPIDLYLRTPGGYYDDAFAVIDAIHAIHAPVNTYAIGGSHSAGTLIVASGTGVRAAYENALLMVHDNLSENFGDYSVDDLENERMLHFWQNFKKIPGDWFTSAGDNMYYLNAEQALQMGLIDTILRPE